MNSCIVSLKQIVLIRDNDYVKESCLWEILTEMLDKADKVNNNLL